MPVNLFHVALSALQNRQICAAAWPTVPGARPPVRAALQPAAPRRCAEWPGRLEHAACRLCLWHAEAAASASGPKDRGPQGHMRAVVPCCSRRARRRWTAHALRCGMLAARLHSCTGTPSRGAPSPHALAGQAGQARSPRRVGEGAGCARGRSGPVRAGDAGLRARFLPGAALRAALAGGAPRARRLRQQLQGHGLG